LRRGGGAHRETYSHSCNEYREANANVRLDAGDDVDGEGQCLELRRTPKDVAAEGGQEEKAPDSGPVVVLQGVEHRQVLGLPHRPGEQQRTCAHAAFVKLEWSFDFQRGSLPAIINARRLVSFI
jgi:hypothetical protein